MAPGKASLLALILALAATSSAGAQPTLDVAVSGALLSRTTTHLTVTVGGATGEIPVSIAIDGEIVQEETLANGQHHITLTDTRLAGGAHTLEVRSGTAEAATQAYAIPAWFSVMPPLIAITLAIAFKDVLLALFLGIFSGALCLFGWNPLTALARTIDTFIAPAITDSGQASILVFTLMLGGMVGLVTKSGGTQGIVESMSRYATNARRGQIATWVMGVLIFFDDYSNSLIVGSTMRPLSDRLKISREKLEIGRAHV